MKIPNIIHQIWIQGEDKIPSKLNSFYLNCQKVNNNFKHEFWDNDRIINLLQEKFSPEHVDLYNRYTIFAQKADFARYAILYVHGGIYLDMDMVCIKNLSPFLKYGLFFTPKPFYKIFGGYLNGIIGVRPNHPVFKIVIKNIFDRQHINNVTKSTGTGLFYDSVIEYSKMSNDNDIMLVDNKYLHPCNIYNDESCPDTCKDCYIAHTNNSSWSPQLRFFKFLFKNKIIIIIIILLIIIIILIIKCKIISF
ncbi:glycosyltransferase [Cotonvirus japonicus]|uniref:Glycosyltransferase n=1 Tax=Cotonvirus japonicus TaxID=2811091 RepID=A0ABM7NSN7_9VIRU|nr:glycosyltransferase [Cotonvirus japonicus]BCS83182.1 glycosyltransferase [Cotonvirus japonicus]